MAADQTCPARSLDVPPHVSYGAPMAILAGRHHLDTERGRILLTTARDGLAAQAGHDLTLEPVTWSGDLEVGADHAPVSLEVRIDMTSIVVRKGTGGLNPLSDRDRREIAVTARKVLAAARHPDATFSATAFAPAGPGSPGPGRAGGVIAGTLTLAGRSRPLRLAVRASGPGSYVATASVTQTDFGIKPYAGFLGALKVRDAVGIQVEISLPEAAAPAAGDPG
jgi:polyisoprenoid-binding protein YceI